MNKTRRLSIFLPHLSSSFLERISSTAPPSFNTFSFFGSSFYKRKDKAFRRRVWNDCVFANTIDTTRLPVAASPLTVINDCGKNVQLHNKLTHSCNLSWTFQVFLERFSLILPIRLLASWVLERFNHQVWDLFRRRHALLTGKARKASFYCARCT